MAKIIIKLIDNKILVVIEILSERLSLEMIVTETEQASKIRIPNDRVIL